MAEAVVNVHRVMRRVAVPGVLLVLCLVGLLAGCRPAQADTTVWAWGRNYEGQVGDGTVTERWLPVQVDGLAGISALAGGVAHSLALRSDGTVWGWGDNSSSQVGVPGYPILAPVRIEGLSDAIQIGAGTFHSLALRGDGHVWSWGGNAYGQLGNGTDGSNGRPGVVLGISGVVGIAAGACHCLALRSDGTVWAWGRNSSGQVGDGTMGTDRWAPVQVQGLTNAVAVAAGDAHSLALKSDGTVWSWGDNTNGEIGDGTTSRRLVPVQVASLTSVIRVASGGSPGYGHSLALRSDGTVWGWGSNARGVLGDGTTTARSRPVQWSG